MSKLDNILDSLWDDAKDSGDRNFYDDEKYKQQIKDLIRKITREVANQYPVQVSGMVDQALSRVNQKVEEL